MVNHKLITVKQVVFARTVETHQTLIQPHFVVATMVDQDLNTPTVHDKTRWFLNSWGHPKKMLRLLLKNAWLIYSK